MADILAPRRARTLYNLADALWPPGPDGRPGAGDRDLLPAVERSLRHEGPGAVRRTVLALWWLEWAPVLAARSRRSFSALARERRRAEVERFATSRWAVRRAALEGLRRRLAAAWGAEAAGGADRAHSSLGA